MWDIGLHGWLLYGCNNVPTGVQCTGLPFGWRDVSRSASPFPNWVLVAATYPPPPPAAPPTPWPRLPPHPLPRSRWRTELVFVNVLAPGERLVNNWSFCESTKKSKIFPNSTNDIHRECQFSRIVFKKINFYGKTDSFTDFFTFEPRRAKNFCQ